MYHFANWRSKPGRIFYLAQISHLTSDSDKPLEPNAKETSAEHFLGLNTTAFSNWTYVHPSPLQIQISYVI